MHMHALLTSDSKGSDRLTHAIPRRPSRAQVLHSRAMKMLFTVIRDKRTSRMFVVTASEIKLCDEHGLWCVIGRIFVVAQLAQLLGGHTAEWSRRLPNLHEVAYSYKEVDRALSTRYLSISRV